MYRSRGMTVQQREEALAERRTHRRPWHGPPHYEGEAQVFMVTAACYEHAPFIGKSPNRMAEFEAQLLETVESAANPIFAWVILPNHYHVVAQVPEMKRLLKELGLLHGRTSFEWNGAEGTRGRKVWHRAAETAMKSERHFFAAVNYVLHNPVRHGYAVKWQDWPYSSAEKYLTELGANEAKRRWLEYPILDFGKGWDEPAL